MGEPATNAIAATAFLTRARTQILDSPPYTCYPEPTAFDSRVGRIEYQRRLALAAAATDEPIELLIHLPFQTGRHLHGARSVHAERPPGAASNLDFARREVERISSRLRDRRRVSRLHVGGTPAFYAPRELQSFIAELFSRFPPLYSAELSIEMDPGVTTEAHLSSLATFGFDRAWVGVADYASPPDLAEGAAADLAATPRALERARAKGFTRLAVDLLCGLPHHSAESFAVAAATAITLGFDRIAIRQAARRHAVADVGDGGAAVAGRAAIDDEARRLLLAAGYQPIGLDQFVRADDPLAAAHNDRTLRRSIGGYTAAPAGDCVGIGVGAVSDVAGAYFQNARRIDTYEADLADWNLPVESGLVRSRDDEIRLLVLRELWCHGRVDLRELGTELAIDHSAYFADDLECLQPLAEEGLVGVSADAVEVLPAGLSFGREIAECFDRRRREPSSDVHTLAFRRRG